MKRLDNFGADGGSAEISVDEDGSAIDDRLNAAAGKGLENGGDMAEDFGQRRNGFCLAQGSKFAPDNSDESGSRDRLGPKRLQNFLHLRNRPERSFVHVAISADGTGGVERESKGNSE